MRVLFLLTFSLLSHSLIAQYTLRFETLSGLIYNFRSPLTIHQEGYKKIKINAKYKSEPFHLPPYYDFRLSLWKNDSSAWGLKFTHHKLILENTTPEVTRFEITHGYNILSVCRFWKRKGFVFNTSIGAIIANPQSMIRGMYFHGGGLFNNGYYLSGVIGEGAIAKYLNITKRWCLLGEVRLTAAWARVKVNSGYADAPNTAVHFLIGTGYSIASINNKKLSFRNRSFSN